jgi:ubiquinone/menaquinone biosynthesis C-methylase UbiE
MHFADRGAAHDFSQAVGGGRVLDFGPGDGWPSLIIAPYIDEVIGVDASLKRVQVCTENAKRLGIANASFIRVPAGQTLPFAEGEFDGVMASSSIEQTPDPAATLAELWRVLKPGGKLRMFYEALERYRGGQERELWYWRQQDGPQFLFVCDRKIEQERVRQYRLSVDLSDEQAQAILAADGTEIDYACLTAAVLEKLVGHITDSAYCDTRHPSGAGWVRMLKEAGFREVQGTHSGSRFARQLFDRLEQRQRPPDMESIDDYLRPLIAQVIVMPKPLDGDPMLTATK